MKRNVYVVVIGRIVVDVGTDRFRYVQQGGVNCLQYKHDEGLWSQVLIIHRFRW